MCLASVSGPSANYRVKVGEVSSKNTFGMVGGILHYIHQEEGLSKTIVVHLCNIKGEKRKSNSKKGSAVVCGLLVKAQSGFLEEKKC